MAVIVGHDDRAQLLARVAGGDPRQLGPALHAERLDGHEMVRNPERRERWAGHVERVLQIAHKGRGGELFDSAGAAGRVVPEVHSSTGAWHVWAMVLSSQLL